MKFICDRINMCPNNFSLFRKKKNQNKCPKYCASVGERRNNVIMKKVTHKSKGYPLFSRNTYTKNVIHNVKNCKTNYLT